jgi:hypothetical protein
MIFFRNNYAMRRPAASWWHRGKPGNTLRHTSNQPIFPLNARKGEKERKKEPANIGNSKKSYTCERDYAPQTTENNGPRKNAPGFPGALFRFQHSKNISFTNRYLSTTAASNRVAA